jgi:histidinol-phosphate/aromatic aminotransferase/cobyric acid decarboxylase-like protein
MSLKSVSRRQFVGGVAAAVGYAGLGPSVDLFAQSARGGNQAARVKLPLSEAVAQYDAAAKLANNENPFGPPDSVIKAMTHAFKYANRYGYPDGGIIDAIAEHHGVKPENIILGAGSSEVLTMTDTTFLQGGKKVVGVEPT